jgi:hypothetical protein
MATPLHPLMTNAEFLDHLMASYPHISRAELLAMLEAHDGGWLAEFGGEPDTEPPDNISSYT